MPSSPPSPTDGSVPADADLTLSGAGLAAFVQSYWTPAGRQAAWNLGWLMAGTGVSQACGLASVLVLTGALGPERFGIYAFSMALYGYLLQIGMAGMGPVVIREATRRPHDLDRLVGAYMSISLTAALLVSGLTWGIAQFTGASADERFLIGCIALANLATCGRLFPFLDAHHRQAGAAVVVAAVDVVWVGLLLAGLATGFLTLRLAGILFLVRAFGTALGELAMYRATVAPLLCRPGTGEMGAILRSSMPVLLTQLAVTIPMTSGVLLVRFFHGEAAAGIMGLATLVLQTFVHLVTIAVRILYPHLTGPYGNERVFQKKVWSFFLVYELLLLGALLVGLWFVVTYFLPGAYAPVLASGVIVLCGGLPLGIAWLQSQILIARRRERTLAAAQFSSSAVFLALAVPAAYRWSHTGVVAAFAVSALLLAVMLLMSNTRTYPPNVIHGSDSTDFPVYRTILE